MVDALINFGFFMLGGSLGFVACAMLAISKTDPVDDYINKEPWGM